MVETVNLHRDECKAWEFYRDWLPSKLLAVYTVGQSKWNATAKNRRSYAARMGYTARHAEWSEWNCHRDDIHVINTSARTRQGQPMNPAYFDYPAEKNIVNTCPFHWYALVITERDGAWYAYSILHMMGELCNISVIIGDSNYLKSGIMLPLMDEIIKLCERSGIKHIDYNTWEGGTSGLQYWKHSVGFEPKYLSE